MKTNTENSCTIEKELSKEELLYIMEKQKEAFEKLKVLESIINNTIIRWLLTMNDPM